MKRLKWCTRFALVGGSCQSNINHMDGTLAKAARCLCRCGSSHSASWSHMFSSDAHAPTCFSSLSEGHF